MICILHINVETPDFLTAHDDFNVYGITSLNTSYMLINLDPNHKGPMTASGRRAVPRFDGLKYSIAAKQRIVDCFVANDRELVVLADADRYMYLIEFPYNYLGCFGRIPSDIVCVSLYRPMSRAGAAICATEDGYIHAFCISTKCKLFELPLPLYHPKKLLCSVDGIFVGYENSIIQINIEGHMQRSFVFEDKRNIKDFSLFGSGIAVLCSQDIIHFMAERGMGFEVMNTTSIPPHILKPERLYIDSRLQHIVVGGACDHTAAFTLMDAHTCDIFQTAKLPKCELALDPLDSVGNAFLVDKSMFICASDGVVRRISTDSAEMLGYIGPGFELLNGNSQYLVLRSRKGSIELYVTKYVAKLT
ncbi:hypothetical protein PCE1_004937 [Barthelona sp. PCE]